MYTFDTGVLTHAGRVRTVNEDNYLVRPRNGLWVVADGMGGHSNGKLASSLVIESLESIDPPASASKLMDDVEQRVVSANTKIREISRTNGGAVLGSTIVALLTFRGSFACLWSGDSRIYMVRGGSIYQISRDHTEVQELVDRGILSAAEAKSWPRANVVTRAIGVHDEFELDFEGGHIEPGDCFVLCSDGLTGHVDDDEINQAALGPDLQKACQQLVDLALERGGKDNITVVLVRARRREIEETQVFAQRPRPSDNGGGR